MLNNNILSDIKNIYGDLSEPSFHKVTKQNKAHIHSHLELLLNEYWVKDYTDVNTDVCCSYRLRDSSEKFLIEFSNIRNYALLMDSVTNEVFFEKTQISSQKLNLVFQSLKKNGVLFLSKQVLETSIKMKLTNTDYPKIYNALFSDQEFLPWE